MKTNKQYRMNDMLIKLSRRVYK